MRKIFEIENHAPKVEAEIRAKAADVQFLSGALRAAKNTPPKLRQKVLTEILSVLGCSPGELSFLFEDANNDNSDDRFYDFPDSERRRQFLSHYQLDAAE